MQLHDVKLQSCFPHNVYTYRIGTTWFTAVMVLSHEEYKCDVFIASIDKYQILTGISPFWTPADWEVLAEKEEINERN